MGRAFVLALPLLVLAAGPEAMSLLIVDWGLARALDDGLTGPHGTPFTMSQKMLAAYVLARLGPGGDPDLVQRFKGIVKCDPLKVKYTVADELESVVKSLLLILSPSLRRCIRQRLDMQSMHEPESSPAAEVFVVLWDCWQDLLQSQREVLQLCLDKDYDGIVAWFANGERLMFLESAHVKSVAAAGTIL